jgi:hypothetical protein
MRAFFQDLPVTTLLSFLSAPPPTRPRPSAAFCLPRFLKNNSHVGEECGEILLQRGTTQVATGKGLCQPLQIITVLIEE